MGRYLTFWTLGCAAGFVAGALVLHRRDVFRVSTLFALVIAWGGLLLGAKWHYRLETLPPLEALLVPPRELLGPGFRLPLGLVTGAAGAALFCWSWRLPSREVGDALAVAASVLIPIGRIGCMLHGCCMGATCGAWAPFCVRLSPNSEGYLAQLEAGLISRSSPLSLPVHPLPAYFALASLLTLGVLLWLLRRRAAPGSLLAAFCILRPLAKLVLEPLRASGSLGSLVIVPLGVLLTTAGVLLAGRWHPARRPEPRLPRASYP
jgi:prolipoprotein diacylglyceryltransferase